MSFVRRTRPTATIIPHRGRCLEPVAPNSWGRLAPTPMPGPRKGPLPEPREAPCPRPSATRSTSGVATITPQPARGDERLDVATKEALLDAVQRAAAGRRRPRAWCSPAAAARSASARTSRSTSSSSQSSDAESLFNTVDEHYNPIVTALATMAKPVVAAVNGVAAGAGASLAFACDFRVLAETAGFNLAFTGIALSCDTGSSWTLPRLVGRAKALGAALVPRTIGAAEALELGLADRGRGRTPSSPRGRGVRARGSPPARPWPTARSAVARRRSPATNGFEESLAFEAEMMALDRRDRGPPRRRRRVRRQGEADLRTVR